MRTPDGCLVHMGRKDFQVKIRGNRVELGEIEAVLLELDDIKETAVVARPDKNGQVQLVAYIVPQQLPRPSVSELRRTLVEKLPPYMLPAIFVFLDEFPQTATDKIDRLALPEPSWGRPVLDNAYVAPRNLQEGHLVALWEEVLGIDRVGIYDNFFELGGDSIKMLQILNRLQPNSSHELLMQVLFDDGTVANLANYIAERVFKKKIK